MTFIQVKTEDISEDSHASSEESVLMMIIIQGKTEGMNEESEWITEDFSKLFLIQVKTEDVSEDSEASSEESGSDDDFYLGYERRDK